MSSIQGMFRAPSGSPFLCNGLDIPSVSWGCFCFLFPVWNSASLSYFSNITVLAWLSMSYVENCALYTLCRLLFSFGCLSQENSYYSILDKNETHISDSHRIYYLNYYLLYICHLLSWKQASFSSTNKEIQVSSYISF